MYRLNAWANLDNEDIKWQKERQIEYIIWDDEYWLIKQSLSSLFDHSFLLSPFTLKHIIEEYQKAWKPTQLNWLATDYNVKLVDQFSWCCKGTIKMAI